MIWVHGEVEYRYYGASLRFLARRGQKASGMCTGDYYGIVTELQFKK